MKAFGESAKELRFEALDGSVEQWEFDVDILLIDEASTVVIIFFKNAAIDEM